MRGDLSWRIEETCFNAFPSLKQVLLGDWLMRFSPAGRTGSLSRRANSVNPLRPECPHIARVIAAAEPLYRAHDRPAIFRVPSIADPTLDRALAAHGYTNEGETCVLHGAIAGLAAAADPEVRLLAAPEREWLGAMAALQGFSAEQSDTYRQIVGAIAIPARFALLAVDGAPAALAYGALHDGLLCYESVVTEFGRRRQGLARRVVGALAGWAGDAGAEAACLQVQADNAPALALYAGFGLSTELYRYHYRRMPAQS
jgi:ribosomal protein S18 acetylase RimI-like enzyme